MQFHSNQKLHHYRIIDKVGAGGMGKVYRAVHESLDRVVALKILSPIDRNNDFLTQFFNEAKIQARLQHPNIATLYDFFEFDGLYCIAMEYIGGLGLDELICESDGIPIGQTLPIFKSVVSAIEYIHENGIQHRDIKPANIRIEQNGEVKLLDFGIAQSTVRRSGSKSDRIIGTLQYMAPELLSGKPSNQRADIWALGVLLYEMLTGRLPFAGETISDYMDGLMNATRLKEAFRHAPLTENVKTIIYRCLQKSPAQRYQTVTALKRDLEQLHYSDSQIVPKPLIEKNNTGSAFSLSKIRLVAGAGAGLFLLIMMLFAFTITSHKDGVPTNNSGRLSVLKSSADSTLQKNAINKAAYRISITGNYPIAEVYCGSKKIGFTPFEGEANIGSRVIVTLRHPDYITQTVEFTVDPIDRRNEIPITLVSSRSAQ
jgi:serine/threonine protein kinase